jgi:hypothetical protein
MVFEFVAVEGKEVKEKWTKTIIAEGKVIAETREQAVFKIGAQLGAKLNDDVEVSVRPF